MKQDYDCPICKKSIGRVHLGEFDKTYRDHIRMEHPKEYKRIQKIAIQADDLRSLKIYPRSLYLYEKE